MIMIRILFIGLIVVVSQVVYPQAPVKYQSEVAGFEYLEIVKGPDPGRLPLLIAFHYSGGTPLETVADFDSLKAPIRILIPKGNYSKRNGFSYFPVDYYQKDSVTQSAMAKVAVDSLAKFVRAMHQKYISKPVVIGISQGGDISLLLAKYYPTLCWVAVSIAPVIPFSIVELGGIRTPVYLFQGENDPIVSVQTTRRKVAAIGKRMDIRLQTYPGVGHEISPQMKVDYSAIVDRLSKVK